MFNKPPIPIDSRVEVQGHLEPGVLVRYEGRQAVVRMDGGRELRCHARRVVWLPSESEIERARKDMKLDSEAFHDCDGT